ncbi:MAG: hypothetical protein MJZ76_00010 [Bacteroidales bacterium]|nr:hypothetical protein [Bacteroidales bacterium]
MNYQFLHRPEPKKFNYKPQYFNEDDLDASEETRQNRRQLSEQEEFARRLHNNWDRRRQRKREDKSSFRTIIWMAFIVFILLFVVFKVFNF